MSFYLSKIIWYILNPFNIILIFFLLSFILSFFKLKIISNFFYISTGIFFFISVILPTGSYLNYLLEKDYHFSNAHPKKIDGILILSGATNPLLSKEYNQIILNGSAERLIESILLINKFPNAKVVFAGGSGYIFNQNLDHASVAKKLFENIGLKNKKIIYENKSRNTYENILFSKKLIKPKRNETWVLITSAFHLKRSLGIAKKLDWNFIPLATDYRKSKNFSWNLSFNFFNNMAEFQNASHEWIGIFSYYIMGRSELIL